MKEYLKALTLVTAVLILAATAHAAEDNWRIGFIAENAAGTGSGGTTQLGVYPTSSDGVDTIAPVQDQVAVYPFPTVTLNVVGNLDDGNTYRKDIKAGDLALPKTWDLRAAGLPDTLYTEIRLRFQGIGSGAYDPPASVSGQAVEYKLEMINNRGVAGAPANGTIWDLPIATTPNYTLPGLLPMLKLSSTSHTAMLNEGYVLEFRQMVPEPSSVMALGTGLMGLMGLAFRRRRK